jgi:hypothetical protein
MVEKTREKDYFDFLKERLLELIKLPIPQDKFNSVENLICRYTTELRESVTKPDKTDEQISLEFKHYVKNVLSVIETLLSGEQHQYKALRRLLQNEIYSCCKVFIDNRKS